MYKSVEHPEINGYVHAYTLKERLKQIEEIKKRSKSQIPWICDGMKNEVQTAFGGAPNGEFIIDPKGKIIRQRFWSSPETLRKDLTELVGKVDKPTRVEDIDVVFRVKERPVASGVLPRMKLPGRFSALASKPDLSKRVPYYAKLRAEVNAEALAGEKGKLYLGLFLDPLYEVHWNNRAGRVRMKLQSDDVELSTTELLSPDVKEDADVDPREFMINIDKAKMGGVIKVEINYMACDDAGTFCVPVTQKYTLRMERDREGGTRPNAFLIGLFRDLDDHDKNKDGKILPEELPKGEVTMFMGHLDKNFDGIIDQKEIKQFRQMFNNGKGFREADTKAPEEPKASAKTGDAK